MDYETIENQPPIEISQDALSTDAIKGIIESFILREGTDYGLKEAQFETKYQQILKQLIKGDIKIVFDPTTESVGLITLQDWQRIHKK